ncbi:MAG: hypothetical protein U0229_11565 [Anaeromyxobacter sp.]
MRLLFAGLLVFGTLIGSVLVLAFVFGDGPVPWWGWTLGGAAFIASIVVSLFVFNRTGERGLTGAEPPARSMAALEAKGLVVRERYRARRAFVIDEFEDEGPHYFLELEDGGVLHLNGQGLYEYEPSDEDPPGKVHPFPCTEFTVLRHRVDAAVLDLECAGVPFTPELRAPPYTRKELERGVPEDGEVIKDRSFDELKRERDTAPGSRKRGRE